MNSGPEKHEREQEPEPPVRNRVMQLPGLAAISLYLLLLGIVIVAGVVNGRHYPPLILIFAAGFIVASGGLPMLYRWAWALALAAVFVIVLYNLWIFVGQHQFAAFMQAFLNLIFFLYLVRPEVRDRLR
jgi:hypothetical protein